MFMDMAKAAARRSTCYRLNVGAVVVYDRSVVSIGYNGAPSGQPHCGGNGCPHFDPGRGCQVIHAEANAIERVAEWKTGNVHELYVTHSPCARCAELILSQPGGFSKIFFETAYRIADPVKALCARGVEVYQLMPNGMMVDQRTGDLR